MVPEIEKYLNNEMSAEARQKFESDLAADPVLRQELEAQQQLIKDLRRMAIARKTKSVQGLRASKKKAKRLAAWAFFGIFLLGGTVWWLSRDGSMDKKPEIEKQAQPKNGPSPGENQPPVLEKTVPPGTENLPKNLPEKQPTKIGTQPIAEKPTRPKTAPQILPGGENKLLSIAKSQYVRPSEYANLRSTGDDDVLKSAKIAFSEERFGDALALIDISKPGEPQFLYGHILFAKANYFLAYQTFSALADDKNHSEWKENAEWFALLSGLASPPGRVPKTVLDSLLEKMLDDAGHPFRVKKALKLKEMMNHE